MAQAQKKISDKEIALRERLMDDFPYYAENVLKIRPKEGGLIPFKLNRLQMALHQIAEKQKKDTGKVRIIIVKGRQGGCSTYTEARYYHKTTHQIGKKAFILTHLGEATANLYSMVQRFYDNTPIQIRPHAGVSNTKELIFDKLDSGYRVSTAGAKGTGRSDTVHYFHGSEVAFWENAAEHAAGVLQASRGADEIILESTANGMNNWFRQQWVDAVSGKSEFKAVFFPWFIEPKYRKTVPDGFVLTDEEVEYKKLYELDTRQMCWKRETETGLGSIELFKQEYPANAEEAFQFSPVESYLDSDLILKAMKRPQYENMSSCAIIAGYDPSFKGVDRDAYILRQGANLFGLETPEFGDSEPARIAFCKRKLDAKNPRLDRLFIDAGAGYGIFSHLRDDGYGDRVRIVEFGASSSNTIIAKTKRDQMFVNFRGLLTDTQIPLSIKVNNETAFLQDATATGFKRDAYNRPKMESKEEIKKRLKMSTDLIDAAILTTAEPVSKESMNTSSYQEADKYVEQCKPWFEQEESQYEQECQPWYERG